MKLCTRCNGPMPKPWYSPYFKGDVCQKCDRELDRIALAKAYPAEMGQKEEHYR